MELSTYVKNLLRQKGFDEKKSQTSSLTLLNAIDDEMLEGIYKFAKEKNKQLYEKEQSLIRQEEILKEKERQIEDENSLLNKRKQAIEEMASFSDERARNGLLLAQKMADLLCWNNGELGERGQESLSYIMWAYFAGSEENKDVLNPLKGDY